MCAACARARLNWKSQKYSRLIAERMASTRKAPSRSIWRRKSSASRAIAHEPFAPQRHPLQEAHRNFRRDPVNVGGGESVQSLFGSCDRFAAGLDHDTRHEEGAAEPFCRRLADLTHRLCPEAAHQLGKSGRGRELIVVIEKVDVGMLIACAHRCRTGEHGR